MTFGFGSGVRAQVFEVIVRQAMAGAPWREICAGPMRVNNITEEEIVAEVDRRLNGGRTSLTEEQRQLLDEYIAGWESVVTKRENGDRSRIEELVRQLYAFFKLKAPTIVFCESPLKLVEHVAEIRKRSRENRRSQISLRPARTLDDLFVSTAPVVAGSEGGPPTSMVLHQALEEVFRRDVNQVVYSYFKFGFRTDFERFNRPIATIYDVASRGIAIEVDQRIPAPPVPEEEIAPPLEGGPFLQMLGHLADEARGRMARQFEEMLRAQARVEPDLGETVFGFYMRGVWASVDLLAFDLVSKCMDTVKFTTEQKVELDLRVELFRLAPWYFFGDQVCFVGMYPSTTHFDDLVRLSNRAGPAATFSDGIEVFAIDGIACPRRLVEHPEQLTVDEIDKERNVAVRRLMIEIYGAPRYLSDSNAELIQKDECGELYRKELPDDEPLVMVVVTNSTPEPDGTYKKYYLRVPPTTQTAKEGVAWSFNQSPGNYNPDVQT